jgi:REP element-mobilizing transposase RayT
MGVFMEFDQSMRSAERKPNRLNNFDYSGSGFYFFTICTKNRKNTLGGYYDEKIIINKNGKIVEQCWRELPGHYLNCVLDEFCIMPNHIHGIIQINNQSCLKQAAATPDTYVPGQKIHGLSEMIKSLKSFASRKINRSMDNNKFEWQRSFYDHIVRNEESLNNIRQYIKKNSLKWEVDVENIKNYNEMKAEEYYKKIIMV